MKHSPQKTTVFYSYESSGNSGVQKTGCAIIQHTPYITREHALQAFESEIELPADCAEGTCSAYALLFDGTLYSVA